MTRTLKRGMQIGAVLTVFGAGYLSGSASEHAALADMKDLGAAVGDAAVKEATGTGGVAGQATKLGTTIDDMSTQIERLEKNLQTLKGIQTALGG
jgi:hypothetical protein